MLIVAFSLQKAVASGDPFPLGARAWGLANASVTLRDGWALWNNAAGLATVKDRQLVMAYDLRYGMKGLQTMAIGYVHPLRAGVAGIGISRLGDELYNENTLSLAYSYAWEKVNLGGKLNYRQIGMAEVGARQSASMDVGVVAQLMPELTFGAHIYSALQSRFDPTTGERTPTIMKAGLAYQASSKIIIVAEVEKDVDFAATFKTGLEYEIVKYLRFRTGIHTRPQLYAFGVGFSPKKLQIDYALRTHPILGLSHQISLNVPILKRKTKESPSTTPK